LEDVYLTIHRHEQGLRRVRYVNITPEMTRKDIRKQFELMNFPPDQARGFARTIDRVRQGKQPHVELSGVMK
jgi:hypothetical protein